MQFDSHRSGWVRRILAALAVCVSTASSHGGTFSPNEQLVSALTDMVDVEFSANRAQFVWSDGSGKLWIGDIDRVTGLFNPLDGKGVLIDGDAMSSYDLVITFNGPEWVTTADGDQIVYTKFVPGKPHTKRTARLARAKQSPDGTWSTEILGADQIRIGPYASTDPADPSPRVTYMDAKNVHYWVDLDNSAVAEKIPGLPPTPLSVRFAQGHRSVLFSTPVNGVSQVFTYGLDSKVLRQITFDAAQKDLQTVPWIWTAPEFDNDFVMMTVTDNNVIRLYRPSVPKDFTSEWVLHHSLSWPENTAVVSPEPFTFAGKSYVSLTMAANADGFASSVWIAGIDPNDPLQRQISDNTEFRARIDPEVFVTTSGPYVYYNRFNPGLSPGRPYCPRCSEGVYRAFTGLTP